MPERTPARTAHEPADAEIEDDAATPMISAHAVFRLILIALTAWTVFEGFALATGSFSAVDANADRTSERMLGGLMIVLGGVYAMLAWRRQQYRLFLWVPFAAQAAIVLPLAFSWDPDRLLLLVISSVFLVLMVYVWWRSRGYDIGTYDEEEWDDEEAIDEEYEEPASSSQPTPRVPSRRDVAQAAAPPQSPPPDVGGRRFRRRDS